MTPAYEPALKEAFFQHTLKTDFTHWCDIQDRGNVVSSIIGKKGEYNPIASISHTKDNIAEHIEWLTHLMKLPDSNWRITFLL